MVTMEQQAKRARLHDATVSKTQPLSDIVQSSLQRYEKSMEQQQQQQAIRASLPRHVPPPIQVPPQPEADVEESPGGGDMTSHDGYPLVDVAVRPPRIQARAPPQDDESVKALADFIVMMDNYAPIIPNSVTRYYLRRSGFACEDDRVIKVISLAAQKFVADIANDAMQFCKIRQEKRSGRDSKHVLTMEDLASALAEQGVHATKPQYFTGSG